MIRCIALLSAMCLTALVATAAPSSSAKRAEVSAALNLTALHPGERAVVAVVLDIKPGFHAQSHTPSEETYIKTEVTPEPNPAVTWGQPIYPPGQDKEYPSLGKLNVYDGRVVIYVPLEVKAEALPGDVKLSGKITYQICDDKACFMPVSPTFTVDTKVVAAGEPTTENQPDLFAEYTPQAQQQEQAQPTFVAPPPEGSRWSVGFAFGAAFVAGLLFNVMPCVLPVLPLKAIGFYEVSQHRRSKSILLGLVFSLGLICVFAALAVVVLVLRLATWGEIFSYAWFVWAIVALLALMGLSLLGVFTFQLPTGAYGFTPRHDTYGGNFLWGALTAILATPCTAPLLPPLLLWASSQPSVVGVPAMLMVGVGMAFPYLILSAMPELARKLPRTGPWAELFKQMMGFLLLAAAAYFAAGRLISGPGFWWVVTTVVAAAGVYLIVRTAQLARNVRAIGTSGVLAALMVGVMLWWTLRVTGNEQFQPYSDATFASLRDQRKPVLVKFTANWCATCQYIEGTVFQDEQVWRTIRDRDVTALKVDLTNSDAPGHELLESLNPAGGIPLTAIYGPNGEQPIVLASVYTRQTLLEALDAATKSPSTPAAAR